MDAHAKLQFYVKHWDNMSRKAILCENSFVYGVKIWKAREQLRVQLSKMWDGYHIFLSSQSQSQSMAGKLHPSVPELVLSLTGWVDPEKIPVTKIRAAKTSF